MANTIEEPAESGEGKALFAFTLKDKRFANKRHELDLNRLTLGEGRAAERVTGMPFGVLSRAMQEGSLEATQAFIFVAIKRAEPTFKHDALDTLEIGDIEFHQAEPEAAPDAEGPTASSSGSEAGSTAG